MPECSNEHPCGHPYCMRCNMEPGERKTLRDVEIRATNQLSFYDLRRGNVERLPMFRNKNGEQIHKNADGSDWPPEAWMNGAVGEMGEVARVLKEIRKGTFSGEGEPGIVGPRTNSMAHAVEWLGHEIADTIIYLDLLAFQFGIDVGRAVRDKFNATSRNNDMAVEIGVDR